MRTSGYGGPTVRNGDRVQSDVRPSEVVSYQLTPEEITARYGPPVEGKKAPMIFDTAMKRKDVDNMTIKMTQDEALNMQETADRIAPIVSVPTEPLKMRICTKCKQEQPADQFRKGQYMCKQCEREYARQRYEAKRAKKEAAKASKEVAAAPVIVKTGPEPEKVIAMDVIGAGQLLVASLIAAADLLGAREDRRYKLSLVVEEA
jgi:hypothetical protein